jgi:hypothetical protein
MLFRCSDGKIIDIKIQSFITDKDYYDILIKITNSYVSNNLFKNCIKNIKN